MGRELVQQPGALERLSRNLSRQVNRHIPDKVHSAIAAGIRTMIETIRTGVRFTPKGDLRRGETLPVMDRLAEERVVKWTQWASAEGAGTGLGGFKLSLVDFPALLSIKLKMLSDLAYIYGYDPNEGSERMFLLSIFQLEYAEVARKREMIDKIKSWNERARYPERCSNRRRSIGSSFSRTIAIRSISKNCCRSFPASVRSSAHGRITASSKASVRRRSTLTASANWKVPTTIRHRNVNDQSDQPSSSSSVAFITSTRCFKSDK